MAVPQKTIEEKIMSWPTAKRIRFAGKIMASVEDFATPEIETAWNEEIATRVAEIREGRAEEVPAEKVIKEARKKLHEARRVSSTGRRRTH